MEFLLLWIDDLDDAFCAFRHIAAEIVGFVGRIRPPAPHTHCW
jgi:hypothetical protein